MSHTLVILAHIVSQTPPNVNSPQTHSELAQCPLTVIVFHRSQQYNNKTPMYDSVLYVNEYKYPVENYKKPVENYKKPVEKVIKEVLEYVRTVNYYT